MGKIIISIADNGHKIAGIVAGFEIVSWLAYAIFGFAWPVFDQFSFHFFVVAAGIFAGGSWLIMQEDFDPWD